MKIIIISPAHPLRGGIAALSERMALALQSAGHEVVIYSFSLQYPSFLFPGKSQITDEPAPENLVVKTRINAINPINWWIVGRAIAQEKPDRILVRYWLPFMSMSLGSILRVIRWFSKRTLTITAIVDNIIPHEKRPGDRILSTYFVGPCTDFLVMSKSVGEDIRTFTHKPVRFAPHPIYDIYGEKVEKPLARQLLGLPEHGRIALFFGFIRAYKGLDILLEAIAQTPDVHLIIAGECYEYWERYAALIRAKGITNRVHLFTDFIPADKVNLYFSAADIVVQPYRTATQSGISQIAYHFDKPMIVSNVGGLPEIVAHGISGYVVHPEPTAIAHAMLAFFDNNQAERMIKGVRKEKKRFSWPYFIETVLAVN